MKYLLIFLISFNLYAVCGPNTVQEISDCKAEDKVGDLIGIMSVTGVGRFSQNGSTIKERYQNSDKKFKRHAENIMFYWKMRESMKKVNCALMDGTEEKKQCQALKGI